MAIRLLQRQRSPEAILSALVRQGGLSRRQAYRYLRQAHSQLQVRPVPKPKAVFTVNLPQWLIRAVRARCRRQHQRLSQVVAAVLEQWLQQRAPHG
jgi:hypothetical protein